MFVLQPELEKQSDLCELAAVVAVFAAVLWESMRGLLLVLQFAVLKAVELSEASELPDLAGAAWIALMKDLVAFGLGLALELPGLAVVL